MLITAGVFALASAFTFLAAQGARAPAAARTRASLCARCRASGRRCVTRRQYKDLLRFLGCIVLYQSGVQTVIALAAIYAQEAMGFTTQDTIVLVLLVNITASLGAFLFGQWQDRLGHRRTLALTLLGWCSMVLIAYFEHGSSRLLGRRQHRRACAWARANPRAARWSVTWRLPTATPSSSGLWGLAVKLASILGPLTLRRGHLAHRQRPSQRNADHGRVLRARARRAQERRPRARPARGDRACA